MSKWLLSDQAILEEQSVGTVFGSQSNKCTVSDMSVDSAL